MLNNLIASFIKLISFFPGIVKAGIGRSQGSGNLCINSLGITLAIKMENHADKS